MDGAGSEMVFDVALHAEREVLNDEGARGVGVAVVDPVALVSEVEKVEVRGPLLRLVEKRGVEGVLRREVPLVVEVAALRALPLAVEARAEAAAKMVAHAARSEERRVGKECRS